MNEKTMRAAGELIRYQASEVFADEEPHLKEVYITVKMNRTDVPTVDIIKTYQIDTES